MNKIHTFQEFLATQGTQIPLIEFIINLLLATFLSFILGKVYVKCARSLSNRSMFADNFMIIAVTTTIIITIVKSSLALSLGLVGALSIVRFRAAIKEPEELAYLFLCIAIGLGFGANQKAVTIIGFVITIIMIILMARRTIHHDNENLFVTISNNQKTYIDLEQITDILNKNCTDIKLKRYDENNELMEATFLVGFSHFDNLRQSTDELRRLNKTIKVTFIDNNGLVH